MTNEIQIEIYETQLGKIFRMGRTQQNPSTSSHCNFNWFSS